jgi:hypothetical protein
MLWFLAAADAGEPPQRASAVHRMLLRAEAIRAEREIGAMAALKRDRWIETEVADLPLGEHDYFERKAGKLFDQPQSQYVIDVSDSPLAPHQSARDHVHCRRQGGRSVPASSFYLDLLRQWLTAPRLEFELTDVEIGQGHAFQGGRDVESRLAFTISNNGRVAAYKWRMRSTRYSAADGRVEDLYLDPRRSPIGRGADNVKIGDSTILPGDAALHHETVGFHFRPNRRTASGPVTKSTRSSKRRSPISLRPRSRLARANRLPSGTSFPTRSCSTSSWTAGGSQIDRRCRLHEFRRRGSRPEVSRPGLTARLYLGR